MKFEWDKNKEKKNIQKHGVTKEYDFTNAQQGKFYRPIEKSDIPNYLDDEVKSFFLEKMKDRTSDFSLNQVINALIKKDIEISKKLAR